MIQAALSTVAVALAATTTHHRRGAFVALIVLIVIVGLAYYAWRQRRLRKQSEHDQR
jgi:cytochrome c biogenesis factor